MVRQALFGAFVMALVSVLFFSSPAQAAQQVENIESSPIPDGLSDEQIVKTMQNAGLIRGWVVKKIAAGHLQATIFVRSHMAKVDIPYDTTAYSIRYVDSDNLGYKNGKIHRNYNKWVKTLDMDIQRSFSMR